MTGHQWWAVTQVQRAYKKLGGKLKMTNAHKSFENQTARERHADFT